jgi:hypothetical protein
MTMKNVKLIVLCHSREYGNPVINLDPRLRGDDNQNCQFDIVNMLILLPPPVSL